MNVTYKKLISFSEEVFHAMGVPHDNAELAAKVLVSADLRGIDSHGVARLSGYVRLWDAGRINPKAEPEIVRETPSTATVDGQAGLGLVIAPKAMEIAIQKSENVGTGWVSVKNSNHFGIAGYHSMMALEKDMIGWSMTNASPLVAPTFSKDRMLGTNPISIAIPSRNEHPFVADFATTTAANGKLEILQRLSKEAPLGWMQNEEGKQVTDPFAVKNGGALLPLGSDRDHGSHKGYCLGGAVDILTAVLSGAGYGPWAPPFVSYVPLPREPKGEGLGHFFGAMRVDAFRSKEEFFSQMDTWLDRFRNSTPVEGQSKVLVPGDPEREMEQIRKDNAFELNDQVAKDLEELGRRFKLGF